MLNYLLAGEHENIANQILRNLTPNIRCAVILGELRMGKTAVVKKIQELLKSIIPSTPLPCIYISLANLQAEYPNATKVEFEGIFLETLLDELLASWESESRPEASPAAPKANQRLWDRYISAYELLINRPVPTTIILDDAERLADYSWGSAIFRHLSYFLETIANVRFILAGTDRLRQWAESLQPKRGLWDNILPVQVTFLYPIKPDRVQQALSNSPEVAQKIIALCGGHPYCLRQLSPDIPATSATRIILNQIDLRAAQYYQELNVTFDSYWDAYQNIEKQICYVLASSAQGLKQEDILSRMTAEQINVHKAKMALDVLRRTGIVHETNAKQIRLTGLFLEWYKNKVGYIPTSDAFGASNPIEQVLQPIVIPTTEFTIWLQDRVVLIRKPHSQNRSDLGSSIPRIQLDFPRKCDSIPTSNSEIFEDNLNVLGRDLWAEFHETAWLQELITSVKNNHHIRFSIPPDMMDFPLELLPLDETGTRRIGTMTPISRSLLKQGSSITREPLALPFNEKRELRALIVAAEIKQDIIVHANHQVDVAPSNSAGRDALSLKRLSLGGEFQNVYQWLQQKPVGSVVSLTMERGISQSDLPTTQTFIDTLTQQQFDIIHFTGHGLYTNHVKGLVFGDGLVPLNTLRSLLEKQVNLRFVYLNCCESARMDGNVYKSNLLGLAQACIEAGVPAVLSMRWQIPVGVARNLADTFYRTFFQRGSLSHSVFEAVKAINQHPEKHVSVYASVPVLLMH